MSNYVYSISTVFDITGVYSYNMTQRSEENCFTKMVPKLRRKCNLYYNISLYLPKDHYTSEYPHLTPKVH